MESILDWNTKEGKIFRGGSGSGINLSNIRGSMEHLSKGGTASGPGQLHARRRLLGRHDQVGRQDPARGQDGRARRRPPRRPRLRLVQGAARRRRRARCATPASTCRSTVTASPRSSTRTPTTRCASRTSSWSAPSAARSGSSPPATDGEVVKTHDAADVLRQIADAAWRCADPGMQYDTTINDWHTCPNSGRINASNPCSEYMHVDDSACNLAVDQPHEVPPRRRHVRHRGLRAHGRRDDPRAGDRRLAVELPDRGDRPERARLPPARPGLRQPRRAADEQRPALRLRRGSRDGRRHHRADDRPRLPRVGRGGRGDGPVRRSTSSTASRTTT